jgi:ribulose-phosphate 3-epimerase
MLQKEECEDLKKLRKLKNSMATSLRIVPAILATTFEDFKKDFKKVEPFCDYVHIDVMDGVFVNNTSFQNIEKVKELNTKKKFELHLMVEHPIEEMKQWLDIKNVFRALFHIEALDGPEDCINFAKKQWEVGVVLNPDTELTRAESYFNLVDVVQFMTVYPGAQGALFVPETETKIRHFTNLKSRPLCAVDGSVNKETIGRLKSWGVEIFNVGTALVKSDDIKKTCQELVALAQA